MKKYFVFISFFLLINNYAHATPCATFQYEELKDMSIEELAKEYCTTASRFSKMLGEAIDRLGYSGRQDEAAKEMHDLKMSQCRNEQDRIARILSRTSKIPTDQLWNEYCKKKS